MLCVEFTIRYYKIQTITVIPTKNDFSILSEELITLITVWWMTASAELSQTLSAETNVWIESNMTSDTWCGFIQKMTLLSLSSEIAASMLKSEHKEEDFKHDRFIEILRYIKDWNVNEINSIVARFTCKLDFISILTLLWPLNGFTFSFSGLLIFII